MTSDNQDPQVFAFSAAAGGTAAPGVGGLLRETRLKLGRDLAMVSATLRIRQPFLEAIEDGRFRDLPGATYAIGFVRGYADYLGLDGQEIVRRFKQENGDLARGNHLVFPSAVSEGGIPTAALLGIAIVAVVAVYAGWHWYQGRASTSSENSEAVPDHLTSMMREPVGSGTEIVPVTPPSVNKPSDTPPLAVSPAPPAEPNASSPASSPASPPVVADAATPSVAEPAHPPVTPGPPSAKPVAKTAKPTENVATATAGAEPTDSPVHAVAHGRIVLQAEDTCWIKILDADGKVVGSRLLKPGESYAPPTRKGYTMTVGNAGALTVTVDGAAIPRLGGVGMVRHDITLDPDRLSGKTSAPEPAALPTGDMPASTPRD